MQLRLSERHPAMDNARIAAAAFFLDYVNKYSQISTAM